ncbi:PREDICTED: sensory neuron membrane protein 2-like [Ceratosolen solmsi marchali]|uniref:Sensory neuron membrane protein 2-like n=1 Tax=Ceratosolen solmsi marchali TaxID=326594 RepID=A0AAJ6YDP1_9HYME|nr:PREDICTED: sensory neuron membrane protein 2-like [Ceratosolen solmsi marchali]
MPGSGVEKVRMKELKCGRSIHFTTKRIGIHNWIIWFLSFLAIFSLILFALSWLTDFFGHAIISNLQLRNGSLSFTWWQRPAVRAVYRVRIFNYTNVDDFETGKVEKLRVQEVGPYIYRETLTRVNPYLGNNAMALSRDMSFLAQVSLTAVLSTIRAKPFIRVPAGNFLWGYDDELFRIAKPVMAWHQGIPYEKFGILAFKAGLSKDRMTINTGTKDLKNLGNTIGFNGMESRNIWHDKSCDKIEGSDGSMFPPQLVWNRNYTLKVYAKEMCRPIPLQYYSESRAKGIPTLRYKLPEDVFTTSSTHNSCFCQKHTDDFGNATYICAPKGLFNTSACNFGAPMLSSFPHFYQADKSLLKYVDGMKPKQELHDSYIDLHPRLGVPIGGWSRVQINMEARKADAVPFMGHLQDGTILPILWIEIGIDEIPESVMNILYHAYYTVNTIEACLHWGSLLGVMLSIVILGYILKARHTDEHTVLHRNVSGQDPLLEATVSRTKNLLIKLWSLQLTELYLILNIINGTELKIIYLKEYIYLYNPFYSRY